MKSLTSKSNKAIRVIILVMCIAATCQSLEAQTEGSNEQGADALKPKSTELPTTPAEQPPSLEKSFVNTGELVQHAKDLGTKYPELWKNEGPHGEIRKCNQFLDRVYRDFNLPVPWNSVIPGVHTMREILEESPDWKVVYRASMPFDKYQPQGGDLVIWDADTTLPSKEIHPAKGRRHIEHSGIMGNKGEIMYAGSYFHNGYAVSDLRQMSRYFGIGSPTVIYRSNHLI